MFLKNKSTYIQGVSKIRLAILTPSRACYEAFFLSKFFTKNVTEKSFINWRVSPLLIRINTRISDTPCIQVYRFKNT
jgi:hypothetical protein